MSSLSFFNGFNNLPNIAASTPTLNAEPAEIAEKICSACSASSAFIEVRREYPAIRTYGADAAVPTKWFTIKAEAAYFTSSTPMTDEYVLYVVQVERQTGEWLIVAGYSGDATTKRRAAFGFAPDRGLARSIVARASPIDTRQASPSDRRHQNATAWRRSIFAGARPALARDGHRRRDVRPGRRLPASTPEPHVGPRFGIVLGPAETGPHREPLRAVAAAHNPVR
jgi:hypothetical protein